MSEARARLEAALSDRYRIEGEVGAGGMATVFLAHDLKHNRKVALKLLRPELAALIGAERFLKEIETTANLQHPHILPLFDSGEASGFLYYVMPYVEGESLRDRLTREKQLGVDEAVQLTCAVASALDYAHRRGVIHRDIKPENILLPDGQPMVADFGIALAVSQAGGTRLTETGLSVGTPHYMSPEQAMGDRELDARSDVYSLGAMLYEMLVGEPPFTGPTAQAIVAKVITEKAPMVTAHRDTVPAHVAQAIRRALAKLPADRIGSAAQFAEALTRPGVLPTEETTLAATAGGLAPRRAGAGRLAAAVALGALVTAAVMWLLLRPAPPAPPVVTRFAVDPGEASVRGSQSPALALSPDGRRLVFPGREGLYLREMDQLEARLIPGTQGAVNVSFSPDGEWVMYDIRNDLNKVRLAGGGSITLARNLGRGASWGDDGTIVYTLFAEPSLYRITDAGGDPTRIATADTAAGETDLRYPDVLPGGRGVLTTVWHTSAADAHIAVISPDGTRKDLGPGMAARYLSSGHIVFADFAGATLLAAPFDLDRLAMGDPVPVLEGVLMSGVGSAHFALSRSGTLAYLSGQSGVTQLLRVDRRGTAVPLTSEGADFWEPRLSPDGRQVAVRVDEEETSNIWVHDLEGGTQTRLTVEGINMDPVWTPDGRRITFSSERNGVVGIFWRPWDGSEPAESLVTHQGAVQTHAGSWTPDGKRLAYRLNTGGSGGGSRDLWSFAPGASPSAEPFLATQFNEVAPQVSPNGRWLAYQSDESGRFEIYVRPFPGGGGRIPVSTAGGMEPVWSRDGRELFYIDPDDRLIATRVESGEAFRVGERTPLFSTDEFRRRVIDANYDVFPDGESFVMVGGLRGASRQLMVVQHWAEEVRQATGGGRPR
ncbi:MAG TPA: protein kinase [Gemmatimonadales bacterium]|nr:protein kinase [Gemmatimonadales bacterium]